MERLKHLEIVRLLQAGKADLIPTGYNIKWKGLPPQPLFEGEVQKEKITIEGNTLPLPTKAIFKAEISPIETYAHGFDYLDYGDVSVFTTAILTDGITFIYDGKDVDIIDDKLMGYIQKYSEAITRRTNKSDFCFDVVIEFEDMRFTIRNLFPTNIEFTRNHFPTNIDFTPSIEASNTDNTFDSVTMKLTYDYMTVDFIDR